MDSLVRRSKVAMPYSRCPKCGKMFHLLAEGDLREWYAKQAPDKKVGDEVSLECFECWKAAGKPISIAERPERKAT